jgi:ATP-dependent Lon protease
VLNLSTTSPSWKQADKDVSEEPGEARSKEDENSSEQDKETGREGVSEAKSDPPSSSKNPEPRDSRGSSATGSGDGGGGSSGGTGDGGKRGRKPGSALVKPVVPEVYPQVMAIPIAKRPLFPGFYKAITVKDPNVMAAITDMMKRGQPYVGAFLFRDEDSDDDVIREPHEVHDVGVFAQVTSAFPINNSDGTTSLTAILYPHRRIRLTELIPPGASESTKEESVKEIPPEPIPAKESDEV